MKTISLVFSHDSVFAGVKQETSHLGERYRDKDGNSLFDSLVFDEEYLVLFRTLFFDARAQVIHALSAYMRDIPAEARSIDTQNFSTDRDLELLLAVDERWNSHLLQPLDSEIRAYLVAYITYRWFENKLPQEAANYFSRADYHLASARSMLFVPFRRKHQYF
jgi:hypothetical protein